jgi:hypothetical protein
MKNKTHIIASSEPNTDTKEFARRVSANLGRLTSELRPQYDFIVCGSGSSGSVVARRLNVLAAQNIRFDKTSVFIEPTRYGDPLGCWQRGKIPISHSISIAPYTEIHVGYSVLVNKAVVNRRLATLRALKHCHGQCPKNRTSNR